MKAPISMCLIVKNEPMLERCILSFKDYIEELIIVDTGSTDGTAEVAKKYANIFEIFTACNNPETGLIEDFSMARQRSFDLSTQPFTMWCDADDLIEGAENLFKITEEILASPHGLEGIELIFPYEYSYNEKGQCTLKHYRERLLLNHKCFHWTNPVHEVIIPNDNVRISMITREDVIWKHHRQFSAKIPENGRNLRILRKYYEKEGDKDARTLYYIGLECSNHNLMDEAIGYLTKYIEVSGWDDEREMACLKLVDIYYGLNNISEAIRWAFKAIEIKEDWGEGYFALARMFYFLAMQGGTQETRNWQRCIYFAQIGLKLPPTKTLLFINPMERELEIHICLNMAFNKLGRVSEALDSAKMGLEKHPDNPILKNNKPLYQNFLSRNQIIENANILKSNNALSQIQLDQIHAVINNLPINPPQEVKMDGLFPVANQAANDQEWLIPENYNFNSFPIKMTDQQLQALTILIWKQYMLHDEVLSAIAFLEKAPYNVRHNVAIEKALKLTKDCLTWMDHNDSFQSVNSPGLDVEAGTPLPLPLIGSAEGHRFDLMMQHMAPNSSIVDFGCMDGCFTNRYGMAGHTALGLDACERSVNLANKKAQQFNTKAQHLCTYFQEAASKVPHNSFDYATSTDTYEHLTDPVNNMFIPAKQMLKSNGKFLLATPHGAWMRGQYLEWAHPWVWAREGKSWLQPSPRAHLIAPTTWTIAQQLRDAGYYVKNSYVDLCGSYKDVEGQGNIFAEACVEAPNNYPQLDIIFFSGDGTEIWHPETIKKVGQGGSETMLAEQAKRLASLGHKVRVYNSCGKYGEGIYEGVEYRETNKFQDLQCDVLVVSRRADMLGDQYNIQAKLKLLWVHDVCAVTATNELLLKADRILALSDWHKQNIVRIHNAHPQQVIETRNGIDLTRFNQNILRNPFKCINSSSPDRSWPILLTVWPEIKKQVPQAELHLFYGFKNWELSAQYDQLQMDLINRLKQQISDMSAQGVIYHDRVNQTQLAHEFMSAGCLLYSTWFTETSFIGGMEAQAAGLRIVSSSIAALNETVGNRGVLIDGDWTSPEYQDKFIQATVKALTDTDNSDRQQLQRYAEQHFDLNQLAEEWEIMFYQLLEDKKTIPIVPYFPTPAYQIGGRGYYDGDPRFGNHNKLLTNEVVK